MYPPGPLLSCSRAACTLAKDPGISHITVLQKLRGLLDGNVVDFRIEGKNRVYFLKKPLRRRCTPIWRSGTRSET
jgi:DNA-binding transcriptional ArsR family regulator